MEEMEKEKKSRWTGILLVINLIIWTIILFIWFVFNGVVNALTPVEANFNYTQNGQAQSYNIKPDGGTTGFIYNNEFFGQTIGHSAYKHYLPTTGNIGEITTTNINGYFQNPCQANEEMSYTMQINFYKQSSSENTMNNVSVVNGINSCSGYLSNLPNSVVYYNVCTIQPGDVPKFSLYFSDNTRGQTYYRVGIPINFSYTCQVGNQAVIDNATANANNIINNQNQNTQATIDAINNANKTCNYINKLEIVKNDYGLDASGNEFAYAYYGITDYINIKNKELKQIKTQEGSNSYMCFYDMNKNVLNCISTLTHGNGEYTIPEDAYYARFTIARASNLPQFTVCMTNAEAEKGYFESLNGAINQGLDASYVPVAVDSTKLEDLEDIENNLHTYTNVDLQAVEVNLDPDTSSWVWNTLTRLLNTNSLVFGMVLSILSLGIIKLILNR